MDVKEKRQLFISTLKNSPLVMMQGCVGERVKREYGFVPKPPVKLAAMYYDEMGKKGLEKTFCDYIEVARRYDLPLLIHSYNRQLKASDLIGTAFEGKDILSDNFYHLLSLANRYPDFIDKIFTGVLMSFNADPYKPEQALSTDDAYAYNRENALAIAALPATHVKSGLMPALTEAIGLSRAISDAGLPYIISFLIRKTGTLMDGTYIHDAIERIDGSVGVKPVYYIAQCVHPINLDLCLSHPKNQTPLVRERLMGLEANASSLSPEELDNSPVIITSDPDELGQAMMELYQKYNLRMLGGCCGTATTHMDVLGHLMREKLDSMNK